jgi:hypothetical protein
MAAAPLPLTPKDAKKGKKAVKCAARVARELFKKEEREEETLEETLEETEEDKEAIDTVKAQTDRMNDKIQRLYAFMKETDGAGAENPLMTDRARLRGARVLFRRVDAEVKRSEALRTKQLSELKPFLPQTEVCNVCLGLRLSPLEASACEALTFRIEEALRVRRTLPCFAELCRKVEGEKKRRPKTETLDALLKGTSAEFQQHFREREYAAGLALKLSEAVERRMCCEAGDMSFQEADEFLYTALLESLQVLQESVDVARIESDARTAWTEDWRRIRTLCGEGEWGEEELNGEGEVKAPLSKLVYYQLTDYLAFEEAALAARSKIGRAAHSKMRELSQAMKLRADLNTSWTAAVPVPAAGPEQQHDDEEHEEED